MLNSANKIYLGAQLNFLFQQIGRDFDLRIAQPTFFKFCANCTIFFYECPLLNSFDFEAVYNHWAQLPHSLN